ncbi:ribonuclease H-like domain-containing protein, partial [Tanacetum coccineum]
NFMSPKPDLSFSVLEEFVNEPIVSEPTVKKPVVETSKAKASVDNFDHLQYDCDNHQRQFNNKKMVKPVWNYTQRVNHQNFSRMTHPSPKRNMVPKVVLMRSGLVSLITARPVNTAQSRTTINSARAMTNLSKSAHSTVKWPIHKNTTFKNSNFNQRVNTIKDKNVNTVRPKAVVNAAKPKAVVNAARPKAVVNAVKGNNVNVVKASACWVWKPKTKVLDHGNPQIDLQDQGVIDSGCSRHMTGNMSYLTDYEEIDGGYVAFGGNPKGGKITGRGTIKTGNLDFENVYFVRELKFNLFSVSQMCDKKNSVLFNDTECIVLSPNFKLTDESQVLLKVPRKNNMYSVDLKNIVPKGGLTCLFAKATSDESKLWHRRLGHINFKTMNKLIKGNLVREMSTSNVHQQSLADAGSETRPPMLERGLYEFIMFTPSDSNEPKMQTEEDLKGDDLKYYEAEIEAMNLILISIPNDIYNSVDACTTAKAMWERVEREALVSVYNRFPQLMNDLERNHIIFPKVTINTKFLNCLQPEWLKYVTQVHLAKRLTDDFYDDLFDYLQQFEKLVNASRAKKLKKSLDPLALVAHTGSSSQYYVTHPSFVVDYDDDYQGDTVQNNSDDPLTSAMILLARAII